MSQHDGFGGLHRDLGSTGAAIGRRRLLRLAAGFGASLGAIELIGCSAASDPTELTGAEDGNGASTGACGRIPEETAGPYPGDASNGPNVLSTSGVVRTDIRSSFGGLAGAADGVPVTLALSLVSASSCAALSGYAIYLWHCDRQGRYSLYSSGVTNQNFLRGVQGADASGKVTFTSIFPGCYAGRWPHIHFEIYRSLAAGTSVTNKIATSQLAIPKAACDLVYATSGYESSKSNLNGVSLASDMVFSDGSQPELANATGSVATGFTLALTVAVNG